MQYSVTSRTSDTEMTGLTAMSPIWPQSMSRPYTGNVKNPSMISTRPMPKFTSSYGFKNWPKPFAPELDTQIVSLSAKVKKSGRRSGKPPTPLVDPDCRLGAFETTVIQPPCPVQYPVSEGERRWMDAEIEELLASIKREVDGCEPRPVVPGSRTDRSQLESGEILDDQPPQQADRQISHQGVKRRAENEPSGPAKCPRRIRWPDHFAMMSYEPRLGKKLYGGPRLERMYLDQQEPYTPVKRLGTGGQGTAHLVKNQRTGSVVVCKVIPHLRSHGYRDSELFFLRDALPPHARIINLQSALTSPYQTQLYLDYCTGGDLASFIESHHYKLTGASVPEAFIWHAFLQLSEALAFIHHGHDRARKRPLEPWRAVIHRDVKPANILLQRAAFDPDHPGLEPYPRLVLADFGLALQADAPGALPESTCSVGTFAYQPPECPLHSAKGDVWAAGAIVYEMCTGNVPFDEQLPASVCDAEAFWTWLAGLGKRERWALFAVEGAGYSRALGNVLRKALEVDVRRRVGSVELVGMVEQGSERAGAKWEEIHPWVWKGGEGEEC